MSDNFNPYREWLGLDAGTTEPTYYDLLGIGRDETDADAIAAAADRAITKVRSFRPGPHAAQWAKLLDDLKDAKSRLSDPAKRNEYNDELARRAASRTSGESATASPAFAEAPAAPVSGEQKVAPPAPAATMTAPVADKPEQPIRTAPSVPTAGQPVRPAPPAAMATPAGTAPAAGPQPVTGPSAPQPPAGNQTAPPAAPVGLPQAPGQTDPMAPAAMPQPTPAVPMGQFTPPSAPMGQPGPAASASQPAPAAPMGPAGSAPVAQVPAAHDPMAPLPAAAPQSPGLASAVPAGPMPATPAPAPSALDPMAPVGVSSPSPHVSSVPAAQPAVPTSANFAAGPSSVSAYATSVASVPGGGADTPPIRPTAATAVSPHTAAAPVGVGAAAPAQDNPAVRSRRTASKLASQRRQQARILPYILAMAGVCILGMAGALYLAFGTAGDKDKNTSVAKRPQGGNRMARPTNSANRSDSFSRIESGLSPSRSGNSGERLFTPETRAPGSRSSATATAPANRLQPTTPAPPQTTADPSEVFKPQPQPDPSEVFKPQPQPDPSEVFKPQVPAMEAESATAAIPEPAKPEPSIPPPTPEELAELSETLKTARLAMTERNLTEANSLLAKAESLAKLPEHQEMVARLQTLSHYVREFWEAVVEGLKGLQGGDELQITESTVVSVVEASPQMLVIRVAGMNRRYPTKEIPGGLAVVIADRWLDQSDPANRVSKGAIYAVDANPDKKADARRLWQEAEQAGIDIQGLLLVLDDDYGSIAK